MLGNKWARCARSARPTRKSLSLLLAAYPRRSAARVNRIDSLLLLALTFSLGGCRIGAEPVRIETSSGPLRISAEIDPSPRKFGEKDLAFYGHVTVTNASERSASFGNSCLMLAIAPESSARAYKDTVASEDIDFATVPLGPGKSLSEPVYWVFRAVPTAPAVELSYGCAVRR